jgi:hypothetical protein
MAEENRKLIYKKQYVNACQTGGHFTLTLNKNNR